MSFEAGGGVVEDAIVHEGEGDGRAALTVNLAKIQTGPIPEFQPIGCTAGHSCRNDRFAKNRAARCRIGEGVPHFSLCIPQGMARNRKTTKPNGDDRIPPAELRRLRGHFAAKLGISLSPPTDRRNLPKHAEIRAFWAPKLVEIGKFDSIEEVMEDDYCFACGFKTHRKTQRAHISARVGDPSKDRIDNVHLLCHVCHVDSEYFDGDAYWNWLKNRTFQDRTISLMMQLGANAADIKAFLCGDETGCEPFLDRLKQRLDPELV